MAGSHEVVVSLYREIRATLTVLVGVTADEEVEEEAVEETAEAETEAAAE